MRQSEDLPLDPELLAELEAIDATLAGRLVDPEFAELAELTVLIAAERPQLSPDRAAALDQRVTWPRAPAQPRSHRSRRFGAVPQWGAGLVALAAASAAVVVLVHPGGATNGSSSSSFNLTPAVRAAHGSGASSSASSSAGAAAKAAPPRTLDGQALAGSRSHSSSSSFSSNGSFKTFSKVGSATNSGALTPAPNPSARKTIQSAQLQLSAPSRWIDVVAQEVFNVVGQEKGIVRSSQVTAASGNGGSATFNLSIPSASLGDTVTRLSALQHSQVSSRTDGSQDVNGQYLSDQRRLGDARALRISLLKQLAGATTQAQIDSLQARIHSAEASINSDQSTLNHLQNQISFSQLYVTVNGGQMVEPLSSGSSSSGGFTIGRAWHDAGRVLTVAAGVALIALAALVPVALLIALIAWTTFWVRRRRREQALDAA